MSTLSESRISALLEPYLQYQLSGDVIAQLSSYLDLLLHWNARTNLTAIREPEQLVQRQIGESLFAAHFLPENSSLLDFGSGAGFPGIPLQIFRKDIAVTLAESQGKKAAFLREAVRHLRIPAAVWAKRVEEMPTAQRFGTVAMRAVDKTADMLAVATERVSADGCLLRFVGEGETPDVEGFERVAEEQVPQSQGRLVKLARI